MLVTRISEELGLKKPQPSITTGNKDAWKKNGNSDNSTRTTGTSTTKDSDNVEGWDIGGNPEEGLTSMGKPRIHFRTP